MYSLSPAALTSQQFFQQPGQSFLFLCGKRREYAVQGLTAIRQDFTGAATASFGQKQGNQPPILPGPAINKLLLLQLVHEPNSRGVGEAQCLAGTQVGASLVESKGI